MISVIKKRGGGKDAGGREGKEETITPFFVAPVKRQGKFFAGGEGREGKKEVPLTYSNSKEAPAAYGEGGKEKRKEGEEGDSKSELLSKILSGLLGERKRKKKKKKGNFRGGEKKERRKGGTKLVLDSLSCIKPDRLGKKKKKERYRGSTYAFPPFIF